MFTFKKWFLLFNKHTVSTLHKPTQQCFLQTSDWKSSQKPNSQVFLFKNDGFKISTFNNSLTCFRDNDVPEDDTAPPSLETIFIAVVRYFCILPVQWVSEFPVTRVIEFYAKPARDTVSVLEASRSPSQIFLQYIFEYITLWLKKSTLKHLPALFSGVLTQVTAAGRTVCAALEPVHDVLQVSAVAAALTPHKQSFDHMVAHCAHARTLVAPAGEAQTVRVGKKNGGVHQLPSRSHLSQIQPLLLIGRLQLLQLMCSVVDVWFRQVMAPHVLNLMTSLDTFHNSNLCSRSM